MGRKSRVGDARPQQRRILEVLAGGEELPGYEIGKRAREVPRNSLHPTLHKMEDLKLIVSRPTKDRRRGVASRYYKMTKRGGRALKLMQELIEVLSGK